MSAEFVSLGWAFESDAKRYVATFFPRLKVSMELAAARRFQLTRLDCPGPASEALHQLQVVERITVRQRLKYAAPETVELETPWLTPRALEAYLIFTYPQWFRLAA